MLNDELSTVTCRSISIVHHSSFIIHRLSFLLSPKENQVGFPDLLIGNLDIFSEAILMNGDHIAADTQKLAIEGPASFQGFKGLNLGRLASKPLIVALFVQSSFQPWGAHLQHVLVGDWILHVQHNTDLVAQVSALINGDAPWPVYRDPENRVPATAKQFKVNQFVSLAADHRLDDLSDPLYQLFVHFPSKKSGPPPTLPTPYSTLKVNNSGLLS
jgi:hypothetical protein